MLVNYADIKSESLNCLVVYSVDIKQFATNNENKNRMRKAV